MLIYESFWTIGKNVCTEKRSATFKKKKVKTLEFEANISFLVESRGEEAHPGR